MSDIDRSESADASRFRWLIDGNGTFLDSLDFCGYFMPHGDEEKDKVRKLIDEEMIKIKQETR